MTFTLEDKLVVQAKAREDITVPGSHTEHSWGGGGMGDGDFFGET